MLTSFRWTCATRSTIVSSPPSPFHAAGSSMAALPGSQMRRSCGAVGRVERGARLRGGGDVALVLVLERERDARSLCLRRRVVKHATEVGQRGDRIGLAPVAERAHDRRAQRGRGAQRSGEHGVLVLAAVALEER